MKHYDEIEKGLQAFLTNPCVVSASQLKRMVQLCAALVLASQCQLRLIARWVKRSGKQRDRIQWVRRCLDAAFLTPEYVYEPFVKHLLAQRYHLSVWHILIDRTHVEGWKEDVVMVSLYYRKRSLPLVWCSVPSGRTPSHVSLSLLKRVSALLPKGASVIFQGDCEFGNVAILEWVNEQGWDFIAAQTGQTHFRHRGSSTFQALSSLAVTPTRSQRLSHVFLSAQHDFGEINLYAFYQPHQNAGSRTREIQYLATSLPLSRLIRTLGKRRWGVECLFRDLKSSGWDIETSYVATAKRKSALLTLIALCYLWLTFIGRWLCKTRRRSLVDASAQRQLSLFQIGWDWLIHQWRCRQPCPHLSMVYF